MIEWSKFTAWLVLHQKDAIAPVADMEGLLDYSLEVEIRGSSCIMMSVSFQEPMDGETELEHSIDNAEIPISHQVRRFPFGSEGHTINTYTRGRADYLDLPPQSARPTETSGRYLQILSPLFSQKTRNDSECPPAGAAFRQPSSIGTCLFSLYVA